MIADASIIATIHFLERNVKHKQEIAQRKNDDSINKAQEMKKADARAVQANTRARQNYINVQKSKDYKTNEKRSHHAPTHNIQQPSKHW